MDQIKITSREGVMQRTVFSLKENGSAIAINAYTLVVLSGAVGPLAL